MLFAGCKADNPCGIVIFPATDTVAPGAAIAFVVTDLKGNARSDGTWSASGGTIDAGGNYVAPVAPGVYLVSYTVKQCTSSAQVTVVLSAVCAATVKAKGVNATTAAVDITNLTAPGCIPAATYGLNVGEPLIDGGVTVDLTTVLNTTSAQVPNLTKNKPYVFAVDGIAADGGTSALSPYTVPLTLYDPPAAPTNLTAGPTTTDSVVLAFTAPTGQAQPVTIAFAVNTGADGGFVPAAAMTLDDSHSLISGLPGGGTVTAEAFAQFTNGEQSPPSNTVTFTLKPGPSPPTSLTADAGFHGVLLNWVAPADAGQPDASIVDFEIDTSHDSTNWTIAANVGGGTTTQFVTFSQADAGTFVFRVIAANQFGNGAPSNTATARPLFPPPAPSASGLVARPGTNQIGVKWKPGSDPTGAFADSFDLFLADAGAGSTAQLVLSVDGGTTTAIITGLTNGAGYTPSIAARNADGTSSVVAAGKVTPDSFIQPSFVFTYQNQNKGAAATDAGVVVFGGLTGNAFGSNVVSTAAAAAAFEFDGYPSSFVAQPSLQRGISNMASVGVPGASGGVTASGIGGLGTDGTTSLANLFDVSEVQTSTDLADGGHTAWSLTSPTGTPPLHDMGYATYNNHVYLAGGIDTTSAVSPYILQAAITNGVVGSFTVQTGASLTPPRYGAAAVAYKNFLYVIGGNPAINSGPVMTDVFVAPINADGSLGTGITTTPLPTGRFLAGAAAWNGRLYVTAGTTDVTGNNGATATREVLVGQLDGNGLVTLWTANPVKLPIAASPYGYNRAPATAQNGYLYVFGAQTFAFGRIDPTSGTIGTAP